jgi:hypothetical protein
VEESGRLEAQLQVFNIVFEPSSTVLVLAVVTVLRSTSSTDTLSSKQFDFDLVSLESVKITMFRLSKFAIC